MSNLINRLVNKKGLFGKTSNFEYIYIDDYRVELDNVNSEILDVENTIAYYVNRKKILEDWKHTLEINIARWDDKDICKNCRFYTKLYCTKFKSSVSEDANCSSFEWSEDSLEL